MGVLKLNGRLFGDTAQFCSTAWKTIVLVSERN